MPRSPRMQPAGGLFHVTARGNRKQPIFLGRDDYMFFMRLLEKVVKERSWNCLAYCLMPNHYHLVVETPKSDLSAGIQFLNGVHGRWFNDAHELVGHVFQGRFHSVLVETTPHLLQLFRYVALNPVRGGLCARPDGWEWSSYTAAVGRRPAPALLAPDRLLGLFGPDPTAARDRMRAFVEERNLMPS